MRKVRTPGDADGSLDAREGAWRCAPLADIHATR